MQTILQDLEATRKRVVKHYILGYTFMCMSVPSVVAFTYLNFIGLGVTCFFLCLFVGFTVILFVEEKERRYRLDYKQKLVASVVDDQGAGLKMDPTSGIGPKDFIASFLFAERPDLYKTEDLVYGKIGATTIHFAEVGAQFLVDGKHASIFEGILFCASFNKHLEGLTLVRPNTPVEMVKKWINKQFYADTRLVTLENLEFDKTFFTQASDQVEARYILTPSMMEKLLKLNQYANSTISVSFVWSNVYIAFPLNHNYFEAPIFKSLLNTSVLDKDLNMLRLMRQVVEELDLNTRIWTKQ